MFDILLLAMPFLCLISAFVFVFFSNPSQLSEEEENFIAKLGKLYQSVKKPVAAKDETHIPIAEMYVHPMRGVRAAS